MPQAASTRWCPTPEQLMILEQLYRGGIRTPNASQIQQITAHLSLYGKIEGKNVFYWFQNHKARDRQKLRRRLGRQQKIFKQQNQQHTCLLHSDTENSSICLTNQNTPQFLHQGGGGSGAMEETAQVMNLLCKLETSDRNEMDIKQQSSSQVGCGSNCMMMMMEMMRGVEQDLPSPVYNRPLKTLELFPTSSTSDLLKEETSSSSTNF